MRHAKCEDFQNNLGLPRRISARFDRAQPECIRNAENTFFEMSESTHELLDLIHLFNFVRKHAATCKKSVGSIDSMAG